MSPNGGERWPIGSTQNIIWRCDTIGGNVRIELSRNSGATWSIIVASTPNDGMFTWPVTGPHSEHTRIRVTPLSNPSKADASDADFAIGGLITAIAPNRGERWAIGSTQNITWTSVALVGSVKIEVSRNGGATWSSIVANTPNDGTHSWIVSGPHSEQARVRITSLTDSAAADVSNANFSIGGTITVTSPNGGESLPVGSTQNITWTSTALLGSVKIEVSRNGGISWALLTGNTLNDGSYLWTVTGPATSQARIRVTSLTDPAATDTNDDLFSISCSPIRVITPNGGETWAIGSTQFISWTSCSSSGTVRIEVSRNGGVTWTTVIGSTPDDGSYSWLVTGPHSTQVRIRVTRLGDASSDTSDGSFTIGGSVTVTAPNGGETWPIGSLRNITWTPSTLTGSVKIELSRNAGTTWSTIIGNTPNDGSYTWTVTSSASTRSRIRVTSLTDPAATDSSNADFTIGGGSLSVSAPNGGENWAIGNTQTISWTSSGLTGNVKIELSRNGGASWSPIATNTPNDGTQTWIVTGPATAQARIRVTSLTDPTVSDASNGNAAIQ